MSELNIDSKIKNVHLLNEHYDRVSLDHYENDAVINLIIENCTIGYLFILGFSDGTITLLNSNITEMVIEYAVECSVTIETSKIEQLEIAESHLIYLKGGEIDKLKLRLSDIETLDVKEFSEK